MSSFHAVPAADLDLLRKFDTPTICNVVELFDMRPRTAGYMNARIQACYPKLPPMVGYASTATFRSAAPPRHGNVYSGLADQVASFAELPGPAVVVYYLKAGKVEPKSYAAARNECRDRIEALAKLLRGKQPS